jgi:hypothetical protein
VGGWEGVELNCKVRFRLWFNFRPDTVSRYITGVPVTTFIAAK